MPIEMWKSLRNTQVKHLPMRQPKRVRQWLRQSRYLGSLLSGSNFNLFVRAPGGTAPGIGDVAPWIEKIGFVSTETAPFTERSALNAARTVAKQIWHTSSLGFRRRPRLLGQNGQKPRLLKRCTSCCKRRFWNCSGCFADHQVQQQLRFASKGELGFMACGGCFGGSTNRRLRELLRSDLATQPSLATKDRRAALDMPSEFTCTAACACLSFMLLTSPPLSRRQGGQMLMVPFSRLHAGEHLLMMPLRALHRCKQAPAHLSTNTFEGDTLR